MGLNLRFAASTALGLFWASYNGLLKAPRSAGADAGSEGIHLRTSIPPPLPVLQALSFKRKCSSYVQFASSFSYRFRKLICIERAEVHHLARIPVVRPDGPAGFRLAMV